MNPINRWSRRDGERRMAPSFERGMNKLVGLLTLLALALALPGCAWNFTTLGSRPMFEQDVINTSEGKLKVTFVGHGTLMFDFEGIIVHVDPTEREADYSDMPKGDVILITHRHGDHLDPKAIEAIRKESTVVLAPEACASDVRGVHPIGNGEVHTSHGLKITAVPAYNIVHRRPSGDAYHPRGEGNGYVVTFGDERVYVAGDTENVPEIKALEDIDVAFLPMNLPYTMTPEMVADAARAIRPKVLYPYHYGNTDTGELVRLLGDEKDIEVRIRNMQ